MHVHISYSVTTPHFHLLNNVLTFFIMYTNFFFLRQGVIILHFDRSPESSCGEEVDEMFVDWDSVPDVGPNPHTNIKVHVVFTFGPIELENSIVVTDFESDESCRCRTHGLRFFMDRDRDMPRMTGLGLHVDAADYS